MPDNLHLLPRPQKLSMKNGKAKLADGGFIRLDLSDPQEAFFAVTDFIDQARAETGHSLRMVAGRHGKCRNTVLTLRMDSAKISNAQGYTLEIADDGIVLTGGGGAGLRYGLLSLAQLVRQFGATIPGMAIEDWPDFPVRGVMLDVSRDKVPTLKTLFDLIDTLSRLKINQVQFYMEHTFEYLNHPKPWARATPLSGDDILRLDRFCRERAIELVPNQNSFGHMERWLRHATYKKLAESPAGIKLHGRKLPSSVLNPTDPKSIELIESLYDELLPHFSSRLLNVGCDETWELGEGKNKALAAKHGKGKLYFDYMLKIAEVVKKRDRTMMFWGDVFMEHPEYVKDLPDDIIALSWGYNWDKDFKSELEQFRKAGLRYYVCPGTSSWNSLIGRTDNAIGNLNNAARTGRKYGALGYLITDWGDNGHWQPLPVSFLPFAHGAAVSWAVDKNTNADVQYPASLHVFRDRTGTIGKLAFELGNAYTCFSFSPKSNTVFARLLLEPVKDAFAKEKIKLSEFDRAEASIRRALISMEKARMERPDAGLIRSEFALASEFAITACGIGRIAHGKGPDPSALAAHLEMLIDRYKAMWLARNRKGGLSDSVKKFKVRVAELKKLAARK